MSKIAFKMVEEFQGPWKHGQTFQRGNGYILKNIISFFVECQTKIGQTT